MLSLLGLLISTGLTIAFYALRRPMRVRSKNEAFVFICLYCITLALALRFGGRTYPGIYFPESPFLNWLFNGNGLFTGVGYLAVVVAWTVGLVLLGRRLPTGRFELALRLVKWTAVVVAVAIALFGIAWAVAMQRLP